MRRYQSMTLLIIVAAVICFFWTQAQKGVAPPPKIPGIIKAPIVGSVEQELLYDYPYYLTLRDRLLTLETSEGNEKEASNLLQEIKTRSMWMGLYDQFLFHYKNPKIPFWYHGPLFEKISQGEVWRLFSPALLHFDLLHIFFNVLWFILLGNQIELRIGKIKYLFLVFLGAGVSNTAQYLMSGPFFMGLSGIVCTLAAFIWARQQKAPWEGYLLHRYTLLFLALFILGMFLLQLIFFSLQLFGKLETTMGIANTAHLMGAAVGYGLGRLRLFQAHPLH